VEEDFQSCCSLMILFFLHLLVLFSWHNRCKTICHSDFFLQMVSPSLLLLLECADGSLFGHMENKRWKLISLLCCYFETDCTKDIKYIELRIPFFSSNSFHLVLLQHLICRFSMFSSHLGVVTGEELVFCKAILFFCNFRFEVVLLVFLVY